MNISDFNSRLNSRGLAPRKSNTGWQARCPAHDDQNASLTVSEGDDGRILLHCHAGCSVESIVGALGLTMTDLFVRDSNSEAPKTRRIVATYDYQDETGKLLFQCVRFHPKDFKQRRPDPDKPGKWIWNLKDTSRVLYRLSELKTAIATGQTIYIAEGEKDVDALVNHGFAATCNPMGAGKWLPEHTDALRNAASVIVIADKDQAGRSHARHVATALRQLVSSVKLIELPDRGDEAVKDAADFFRLGGSVGELNAIVEGASEFNLQFDKRTYRRGSIRTEYLGEDSGSSNELIERPPKSSSQPLPVPPYKPPPLDLLPDELQDYVFAASESLAVDISYVLVPLLSALGTAVGRSRIIQLKPGFIQPPIVWTGIIGRSGSKKSPALAEATFSTRERERVLIRQNDQARQEYEKELAQWESASRKQRGSRPAPPHRLTVVMDDLTLASVALALAENPSVLVIKDELSHWFQSFDQFHKAAGADVSRWLSLHTGVLFAFDRKTDRERYRLFNPRICIAGGIQPKILRRCLTEEFFDRGLPARFLFACPPDQPDHWTEKTVPESTRKAAHEVFHRLFALSPLKSSDGESQPKPLLLDADAKDEFVAFYNAVGAEAAEADERQEAAWHKLTGYGARLALLGELARRNTDRISGDVMRAATGLARWFGAESQRIYRILAETPEAAQLRKLSEFVARRGNDVTVRDLITNYRPLKNLSALAEQQLNQLANTGRGDWLPMSASPKGGQPSRRFRLISSEPLCLRLQNPEIPSGNGGIADADDARTKRLQTENPVSVIGGLVEEFV